MVYNGTMEGYSTGTKVRDEELSDVNIIHKDFHGEWNYIIAPLKC